MFSTLIPSFSLYYQFYPTTPLYSKTLKKDIPIFHSPPILKIYTILLHIKTPYFISFIFFLFSSSRPIIPRGIQSIRGRPVSVWGERSVALAGKLTCSQSLNASAMASSLSVWGRWISPNYLLNSMIH